MYYVYALVKSGTKDVMYIGVTGDPEARLKIHRYSNRFKSICINLIIIASFKEKRESYVYERLWIKRLVEWGIVLVNKNLPIKSYDVRFPGCIKKERYKTNNLRLSMDCYISSLIGIDEIKLNKDLRKFINQTAKVKDITTLVQDKK